jgi:uncharacterized protein
MAHPNEDLARRGYEAFANGDMQTLNELFADDIVWHSPGRNPLSGDFKGKDQVFQLFARLAEVTGGTFRQELHDVMANDEHVVALAEVTAQREGKSFHDRSVNLFHISDGKVTEFWLYPGDQYAADEFFG